MGMQKPGVILDILASCLVLEVKIKGEHPETTRAGDFKDIQDV